MRSGAGWAARTWEKERRAWSGRPNLWKLYLLLTASFALQTALAGSRGDRWLTGLSVVGVVLSAALTTLAYKAAHPR